MTEAPRAGDIEQNVADVLGGVLGNATARNTLFLLHYLGPAVGLVDAEDRLEVDNKELVPAFELLQQHRLIQWRPKGEADNQGRRPVRVYPSERGRYWIAQWQRLCQGFESSPDPRSSRNWAGASAEFILHDLLDDVLGLQLGTEMFGPWEEIEKSPFAAYTVYWLEQAARAIGWTEPGYWEWRATADSESTEDPGPGFEVLHLLVRRGIRVRFETLCLTLGWPPEAVSAQLKQLNKDGLVVGLPGADRRMSYAATRAGYRFVGQHLPPQSISNIQGPDSPSNSRATGDLPVDPADVSGEDAACAEDARDVVDRLTKDLNQRLGPESLADWFGGEEE